MGKYNSIAVIYGSDSSEWEVSCRSGEYVASAIDDTAYDVYEVFARFGVWQLVAYRKRNAMRVIFPEGSRPEIDKNDFSVKVLGDKVKCDFAYVVQHGAPGETGQIEGYFEMLGIPCSTCDSSTCSIVFDKYACKCYIRELGLAKCAPDVFVRHGMDHQEAQDEVARKLQFPVFVKPTQGGSSFGVTRVTNPEDMAHAIRYAFSENDTVLIEQGVVGRELTCAAYFDGKQVSTLPLIEIVSENEYFDYDAKYNGHSQELCPAPVSDEIRELVQQTTARIYFRLGCRGVVRMDYILAEDGLYFLEINTIPGMTSASLVPRMVRTGGLDMTAFLTTLIENS